MPEKNIDAKLLQGKEPDGLSGKRAGNRLSKLPLLKYILILQIENYTPVDIKTIHILIFIKSIRDWSYSKEKLSSSLCHSRTDEGNERNRKKNITAPWWIEKQKKISEVTGASRISKNVETTAYQSNIRKKCKLSSISPWTC